MPLLPWAVIRYSALSSKSAGEPPRQMMKVFCRTTVAGVISPIVYSMLVIMAFVTTAMTAPLIDWLAPAGQPA
mgnify:CR=1 FL=1